MPRLAAALSITNTMNPHLFFHHPYRSCSPATSSSTISTWRSRCHRTRAGDQEYRLKRKKKEDRRKAARKRRAAGTSLQHAKEEVQPRRRDLVREKQKTLSYKD